VIQVGAFQWNARRAAAADAIGAAYDTRIDMPRTRNAAPPPRSLKVSAAFKAFVLDQLDALGEVTAKSMFGGVGLYCGGIFFGIIARDVLYMRVDDESRGDYEREGMRPFKPYADRPGTMQYYAVPVDVLESAPDLVTWARKAVAAAERM
jgi:DNA transformation protein